MINFNFGIKTQLFFGEGRTLEIAKILKEKGFKRITIVIGGGSIKTEGRLDSILKSFKEEKIEYILLEGVRPNPTKQLGDEFIKTIKEYKPELILAIGGGSVIDTAKYMSVGYYYDGDTFDFNLGKNKPEKALPLGVILTISASGSEMSTSCVIQDDDLMIKKGFNSELVRPLFAIEDPNWTLFVNEYQTGCGIVDIMMHTLERYFQPSINDYELADNLAIGLLKSVIEAGKRLILDKTDYQARATLMLASSLSHNGLTNIGKPFFMPVHQLEHALSGVYPQIAHGAGLSILFPAWAEFFMDEHLDKLSRLGKELFDIAGDNQKEVCKQTIQAFRDYFVSVGMPIYLEEFNIKGFDIKKVVDVLLDNGRKVINDNTKVINYKNASIIYESCLRKI